MTQADRVLSTPPTNTSSRRNFLAQAAVVAAGGAALGVVLPLPVSAGDSLRVPDPILAAIETHKAAAAATEAAHKRLSAFENELADNERLQRDRRHEDETRRGEEIEAAIEEAFHTEEVAAYELLNVDPTTMAGVVALLTYACDHDDAAHGMGWPEAIACEEAKDTRSWQYFLIANLVEILPGLMAGRA
jgi:hypothetical protein